MNDTHKHKIIRFVSDEVMKAAVRNVLMQSFLKERPDADVHQLAAAKIAIDMLQKAFKDMERIAFTEEKEGKLDKNVGL